MGVDLEVLDKLFDEKKIEELHAELTPHSEEKNVDIQWRFARASKDLAEKNQSDKKKYEEYMRMGLKAAESEYQYCCIQYTVYVYSDTMILFLHL